QNEAGGLAEVGSLPVPAQGMDQAPRGNQQYDAYRPNSPRPSLCEPAADDGENDHQSSDQRGPMKPCEGPVGQPPTDGGLPRQRNAGKGNDKQNDPRGPKAPLVRRSARNLPCLGYHELRGVRPAIPC